MLDRRYDGTRLGAAAPRLARRRRAARAAAPEPAGRGRAGIWHPPPQRRRQKIFAAARQPRHRRVRVVNGHHRADDVPRLGRQLRQLPVRHGRALRGRAVERRADATTRRTGCATRPRPRCSTASRRGCRTPSPRTSSSSSTGPAACPSATRPGRSKMEVARDAVSLFVQLVRADAGNRVGLVSFSTATNSPVDLPLSPAQRRPPGRH